MKLVFHEALAFFFAVVADEKRMGLRFGTHSMQFPIQLRIYYVP